MIEKGTLRDYQIVDLAFYMEEKRWMNLSDPGTGKTPSVCAFLGYLWTEFQEMSMWLMPKSLLKKNLKELVRFSELNEDDVVIYDGTPKQLEKIRNESKAKVWLMGFDRFKSDWKLLPGVGKNIFVDEFHMGFGRSTSKRTEALFEATRPKFCNRFGAMTGTLINGRLDSAYPAIHIVEPRYYGSQQSFEWQHAVKDDNGKIQAWKNHDKLARIFARHAIRRTFESVYGNQDPVIEIERCDMVPAQREKYDEFAEAAVLELEDRFLDGGQPGVHAIRCRQIMAHPEHVRLPVAWDDKGKPKEWKVYSLIPKGTPTGKDERLLVHLADHRNTGKPLVIFASLVPEQERIYNLCVQQGFRVGLINGTVPSSTRSKIDLAFQRGELDIIVASPPTAGVGFNWQYWGASQEEVETVIFASLDYMDSNFAQAYKRMIRGERKRPLRVIVLEYEDSIDQRIFEIVERKSRDANLVDGSYVVLNLTQKKPSAATIAQVKFPKMTEKGVFGLGAFE